MYTLNCYTCTHLLASLMACVSLTLGKGQSGTGTLRKSHSGLLARGHCAEHVQARGGGGRHHLVVHHLDEGVCAHEGVEPAAGPGLHGEVQRQDGAPHTLIPPHTGDI